MLTYEFLNQHHNVGHCLSLCDEGDKGLTHYGALHKVVHLVIRSPIKMAHGLVEWFDEDEKDVNSIYGLHSH